MGDRGIPKTWRHMNGYDSHTYMWINEAGEKSWVKYHFISDQGVKDLTGAEANRIAGEDADYHRRDLHDAIARSELPSWTLSVQVMPYADAKDYRFNPFDRIGTNFHQLPVNRPHVPVNNYMFDGAMTYDHTGDQAVYAPNSIGRPFADLTGPVEDSWMDVDGDTGKQIEAIVRAAHNGASSARASTHVCRLLTSSARHACVVSGQFCRPLGGQSTGSGLADGERQPVNARTRLAIGGDPFPDSSCQGLHPVSIESGAQAQHDTQDAGSGRVALPDAAGHVFLVGSGSDKSLSHKGIGMSRKPHALLCQGPHHAGS